MKEYTIDDSIQDEDLSWASRAYTVPEAAASTGLDEEAFSYADEEHTDDDVLEESVESVEKGKGKRRKSPERISLETKFVDLYEEYMHPEKPLSAFRTQCQLDDLILILYQLNAGWAYRKANRYKLAGFCSVDAEMALSVGCAAACDILKEDKANGNYSSYPIGRYLRIAQNKSIDDYFRTEFGRLSSRKEKGNPDDRAPVEAEETRPSRKEPYMTSLDAMQLDHDGTFRGDWKIELSNDPFEHLKRSRTERDRKANRLAAGYLRALMDYPDDPPKPLALMYGSILFQLYKDYGGDDELSKMAKQSTKLTSPEWAHRRMGNATLLQLGIYSERVVRRCFDKSLTWGSNFTEHMQEVSEDGRQRKWADIIYTKTYSEGNTANWIESIMKSTLVKLSRKMTDDPELTEYAMETLGKKNKFRKALEKIEKEDCR